MLRQAVVMAYAIQQKISRMRTAYTDTVVHLTTNQTKKDENFRATMKVV
jgi:hypothetical protein